MLPPCVGLRCQVVGNLILLRFQEMLRLLYIWHLNAGQDLLFLDLLLHLVDLFLSLRRCLVQHHLLLSGV